VGAVHHARSALGQPSVGRLCALLTVLLLASCAKEPEPDAGTALILEQSTIVDLPGWQADGMLGALSAFQRSCRRIERGAETQGFGPGVRFGTRAEWRPACAAATDVPRTAEAAREFFEAHFQVWRATDGNPDDDLFTGYFEPILNGSRAPSPDYPVPLYARPADLVLVDLGDFRDGMKGERIAGRLRDGRLKPYDSRADIAAGSLDGTAPVVLWLDDPVEAFFLHIQGSGLVRLPGGGLTRVGYDGHNGHVYYAIGRYLVNSGAVAKEDMSLQAIRRWLAANPGRTAEVMNKNPSYIFFRELSGEGPIGAHGVPLTPGRSLAIDRRHLPLGAPIYVDIDVGDETGRPLRRLMVAQDTGGAIRGPVRADVFWGAGEPAEKLAGPMAATGRYWLLLPKAVNPNAKAAPTS